MIERVLDWRSHHDPRSRAFPIRALVGPVRPRRRNKLWRPGPILDQGAEGACVGHGWAAEAFATPTTVRLERVKAEVPRDPQEFAFWLYRQAQKIDEFPGEDYSGTSVLAGAKVMQQLGLLREYRWAFGIEDVIDAVLTKGPVVIGIPWRAGMYEAPGGVLTPRGSVVGGHCLLVVGYRLSAVDDRDAVVLQNSWGRSWGTGGLAAIRVDHLEQLLADEGEACVPVKRAYGRAPTI